MFGMERLSGWRAVTSLRLHFSTVKNAISVGELPVIRRQDDGQPAEMKNTEGMSSGGVGVITQAETRPDAEALRLY